MRVALELQPICGKRSGIGTYTYELAKRLRNQDGLEFQGKLFNFCGRHDNSEALAGITMPIQTSRIFSYGVYRRIWDVLPIPYEMMFQSADLSLFFNYIVPPHIQGKVMTTVHDLTYLRFPETVERRNLLRLQKSMAYSVERSCHLLTVTEFSKREITELLGIPPERISVVPCAPAAQAPAADFLAVTAKFRIHRPYVLYVGTIEPRKNLTRLIRAFDFLKRTEKLPHQLVLAGGSGWGNEEIYETAHRMNCREDIRFTGYISAAEKSALYQNADAFVFPSIYEGFGIPPLEAMEMECPVVCANAASLPEVVGDAAQLVEPLDEHGIADGILKVLIDETYAAQLRCKGRVQFKKYTWDDSARKLTEVCRRVLEES